MDSGIHWRGRVCKLMNPVFCWQTKVCYDNEVNIVFVSAVLSFWSQNNILSVEGFIQSGRQFVDRVS